MPPSPVAAAPTPPPHHAGLPPGYCWDSWDGSEAVPPADGGSFPPAAPAHYMYQQPGMEGDTLPPGYPPFGAPAPPPPGVGFGGWAGPYPGAAGPYADFCYHADMPPAPPGPPPWDPSAAPAPTPGYTPYVHCPYGAPQYFAPPAGPPPAVQDGTEGAAYAAPESPPPQPQQPPPPGFSAPPAEAAACPRKTPFHPPATAAPRPPAAAPPRGAGGGQSRKTPFSAAPHGAAAVGADAAPAPPAPMPWLYDPDSGLPAPPVERVFAVGDPVRTTRQLLFKSGRAAGKGDAAVVDEVPGRKAGAAARVRIGRRSFDVYPGDIAHDVH